MSVIKNGCLKERFSKKMEKNYDNLSDCFRRSRVPLSMETIRKFIYDGEDINSLSLILFAKYLGFTKAEIKEFLKLSIPKGADPADKDVRVTKDLIDLISDTDPSVTLSPHEDATLDFIRKIKDVDDKYYFLLVRTAETIAALINAGIDEANRMRMPVENQRQRR